ncbi:MAG: ATP-binding protein, partial [Muribaculaceae bacterium]|nr:ATP-binding protein [Muribaculaceae bacterium]
AFLHYMQEGGLPELINLPDEDMKQRYMAGLRDSIMLKDIVKRYAIKDIGLLENLLAYVVNNSSSLISITGITNYLKSRGSKSSYETIATYLIYLQEAFIIHKSERYNISGKALLAGNFKVYPNDQAYHNYLYPTVRFGNGYILEGIVYMELIRKGYKVNTGVIRDKEIDFIAVKNDRILYVQVAYILTDEVTAEREYASLEYVKGIGEKFLVTLDDVSYPIRNGVRHIQAWEFHKYI